MKYTVVGLEKFKISGSKYSHRCLLWFIHYSFAIYVHFVRVSCIISMMECMVHLTAWCLTMLLWIQKFLVLMRKLRNFHQAFGVLHVIPLTVLPRMYSYPRYVPVLYFQQLCFQTYLQVMLQSSLVFLIRMDNKLKVSLAGYCLLIKSMFSYFTLVFSQLGWCWGVVVLQKHGSLYMFNSLHFQWI